MRENNAESMEKGGHNTGLLLSKALGTGMPLVPGSLEVVLL